MLHRLRAKMMMKILKKNDIKTENAKKFPSNLYLRFASFVGALQLIKLQGHLAVILIACDVDQHESIGCCCNDDDEVIEGK